MISTFERDAPKFALPTGVDVDVDGNVFVADFGGHRVARIDLATRAVGTVAGSGVAGFSLDDKSAVSARLNRPHSVKVARNGDVFFSDRDNHRIRRVRASDGIIETVAGSGLAGLSLEPPAIVTTAAAGVIAYPEGIALDSMGNLYIASATMDRVRRVSGAGAILETIAGTGGADPTELAPGERRDARQVTLARLSPLALDATESRLAFGDVHRVYELDLDVSPVMIARSAGLYVDELRTSFPALDLDLGNVVGLALSPVSGRLYFTDQRNHRVYELLEDGLVRMVAGTGAFDEPSFSSATGIDGSSRAVPGAPVDRLEDDGDALVVATSIRASPRSSESGLIRRGRNPERHHRWCCIDQPTGIARRRTDGHLFLADTGTSHPRVRRDGREGRVIAGGGGLCDVPWRRVTRRPCSSIRQKTSRSIAMGRQRYEPSRRACAATEWRDLRRQRLASMTKGART